MLGLGTSLSTQIAGSSYKELSELNNYADLDVHFDFSTLTGTHGATVSLPIANSSTAGTPSNFNITSLTATPTLDLSTMGKASVAFDSSEEILNMAAAYTTSGKAFTFFIVVHRSDTTNDMTVASTTVTDTGEPDDYIRFMGAGGDVTIALENKAAVAVATDSTGGTTTDYTAIADRNMVYVIRRNASPGSVFIYGDAGLYIAAKATGPMQLGATFELGHIGGTTAGSYADLIGNIGEVGLYDVALTAADTIILAKELSNKWGISINPLTIDV